MRKLGILLFIIISIFLVAEEDKEKETPTVHTIKQKNGNKIEYFTLKCNPAKPRFAITTDGPAGIRAWKLSQIDITSLPANHQEEINNYTKEQKDLGNILYKDEWCNRNEILLKTDNRYSYKKLLARTGKNKVIIVNKTNKVITIGVRMDDKGYETSAGPNESSNIAGLHDGTYYFYLAEESEDKKFLQVMKFKEQKLKNVIYTLTYGDTSNKGMKGEDVGRIEIKDPIE